MGPIIACYAVLLFPYVLARRCAPVIASFFDKTREIEMLKALQIGALRSNLVKFKNDLNKLQKDLTKIVNLENHFIFIDGNDSFEQCKNLIHNIDSYYKENIKALVEGGYLTKNDRLQFYSDIINPKNINMQQCERKGYEEKKAEDKNQNQFNAATIWSDSINDGGS